MPLRSSSPTGPPADGAPPFLVRLDLVEGRVELCGRLDHRSAHLFGDAVSALLLSSREHWSVDLTGLTGCDSSGVRVIGAAYRRALRHGRRLTLVGAPPDLRHALFRLRMHTHLLDGRPEAAPAPERRPA